MSDVRRFMAPGPWLTRDLKECVLASDYDDLREAAEKVTCATCDGEGKLDDGEWMPCPDCGDLRRLLGEKP